MSLSLGSLGKRTKFQEKDIAQLLLQVTVSDSGTTHTTPPAHSTPSQTTPTHSTPSQTASLPKDLALGDDTLLDKIEFTEQLPQLQLTPLQQAVVLGEWSEHMNDTDSLFLYALCVHVKPHNNIMLLELI